MFDFFVAATSENLPEVEHCIDWYKLVFLDIMVAKTKKTVIEPLFYGHIVQTVHKFKYLGTVIGDKLTFDPRLDSVWRLVSAHIFFWELRNGWIPLF